MQGKGAIKLIAIVFALACIYSLSFTYVSKRVEKKAAAYAQGDSVLLARYLDSIETEPVYNLGIREFTYEEVKERQMNLGLDLKGGMNVTLELSMAELLRALSNNNEDPAFNQALEVARKRAMNSQEDYISLFTDAYQEQAPGSRLAEIFSTPENRNQVPLNASDEQVGQFLRNQANAALNNSFNILRTRIDRFGVTQPNIQKSGTSRISVELPGVTDAERVRNLLKGSASLEFWKTYDNQELFQNLNNANTSLAGLLKKSTDTTSAGEAETEEQEEQPALAQQIEEAEAGDTTEAGQEQEPSLLEQLGSDTAAGDTGELADFNRQNPLFAALTPNIDQAQQMPGPGPTIGYAHQRDTAQVMAWLNQKELRANFPADVKFAWGATSIGENTYALYALKNVSRQKGPALAGDVISDARSDFDQRGRPEVLMFMNPTGAREWRRITAEAAGNPANERDNKSVAIVLDGMVYSAPRVESEIAGGVSNISGSFEIEETQDLANVLKAGRLPAPVSIVQEMVVGPTLGQLSIQKGLTSSVIGFLSVLLFMGLYYRKAGWIASFALLVNIFFITGTLASLGAVLTLPGIAGIVLTMGIAVDSNVIIYERIREELAAGKGIRSAIEQGYKHAYSAVVDMNVTGLITGIILMIFGSGLILSFATTFVIGILTSFFTAVFISRIIFEGLLSKKKKISFYGNITKKWMSNTRFDFVTGRRRFYILSGIILIAGLISMFTKGFSLGVDFKGGRTYIAELSRQVPAEELRASLDEAFGASTEVKAIPGTNRAKITTSYLIEDNSGEADQEVLSRLEAGLKKADPDFNPKNGIESGEKVGPTIASDIRQNAVYALLLAVVAIFLYIAIRFRNWQFGLGALIALAHDLLALLAIFSIFNGILPFSMDIDQQFIAAALTVLGYSINDSVVIFDRIREYMGHASTAGQPMSGIINNALNSTLSRTVVTGATALLVLGILVVFGGESIRGFSFAMMLGVIFGTYSSLFVAAPVIVEFIRAKQK